MGILSEWRIDSASGDPIHLLLFYAPHPLTGWREPWLPKKPACLQTWLLRGIDIGMIRKLKSGEYRLYSRKMDAKTGKRKNLGTFSTRAAAEKHERAVQYFKRH